MQNYFSKYIHEENEKFEELEKRLQNFNWYFDRQDCNKTYVKGIEEKKQIKELIMQCRKIDSRWTTTIIIRYQKVDGMFF